MANPYHNAEQHLADQLVLVRGLVERQIQAHWEAGVLPRIHDEFSGTFVSGGEVQALLGHGPRPTPAGLLRLGALDHQITALTTHIENRLAASRKQGKTLPLDQLRRAFGLTPTEQRALTVLLALEIDPRLRQLMRYLVNEANRIHADVGLVQLLVYSHASVQRLVVREMAADGRLFRYRLVEPVGAFQGQNDAPFLLRSMRVARRVVELAYGELRLDPDVSEWARLEPAPSPLDELVLPDQLKSKVYELVRAAVPTVGSDPAPMILLAGSEGSGRKALAYGAAHAISAPALRIDCASLPKDPEQLELTVRRCVREAILYGAVLVLEGIDAVSPAVEQRADHAAYIERALAMFRGPVAATCGDSDGKPVDSKRGVVRVDVPTPPEGDRIVLWKRALAAAGTDIDLTLLASRYPVTGGIIKRAARAALAIRDARGADQVNADDVHAGLRGTLDAKLSTLGTRVERQQTWKDLVLPDESFDEIREFLARVKHRRQVYEHWGFARKMAKGLGLSALFAGPPGTGKTMVAGIIAHELALDLYQIDLSRIVSKYVGETEKNLANVFDAAEAGHAVLLFDEADSLFAKRTEVKSSVDRYANLEVNYLLQRLETFNGITILTTNLDSSIDDAFKRRIAFRVTFPFPEPEDRERLWRTMLPKEAEVSEHMEFEVLANKFEMTGGYIRNAVLRAAFLAASESSVITMEHMMRAANLEYAAMGKVMSSL